MLRIGGLCIDGSYRKYAWRGQRRADGPNDPVELERAEGLGAERLLLLRTSTVRRLQIDEEARDEDSCDAIQENSMSEPAYRTAGWDDGGSKRYIRG